MKLYPVKNWGIIVPFEDVLSQTNINPAVHNLYMHIDPKDVVSSLLVSPDAYEAFTIYDYIYENYAGAASVHELHEITDHIDHLYKLIHTKINKLIRAKHLHDTYTLHKWISDSCALVGSAQYRANT